MIYNKHSLSVTRATKEEMMERRNPALKVSRLLNQYHSIDNLNATDKEKEKAKARLRREILSNGRRIGQRFQNMLTGYINNKNLWFEERDKIM